MKKFEQKSLIELATLLNDLDKEIKRLSDLRNDVELEIDKRMYIEDKPKCYIKERGDYI